MIHTTLICRLLTLGFGGVLMAGSVAALLLSEVAVAETQQTGTPLSNPTTRTTQADHAAKITPEQEAALVEVRKILIEARKVAEGIQLPSPLLTKQATIRALEETKKKLLWSIEETQLQAGDLGIQPVPGSINFEYYLTLAHARYGQTKKVVESAARVKLDENELLYVVDDVIEAGDIPAAFKVVDATMTKEVAHAQRFRSRAAALALIAQRQYEQGDSEGKTTLQQALKEAQNVIAPPEDVYWAFIHVGRVQGVVGDRAGSTESFRQALKAARGRLNEEPSSGKLQWIAKAQAEAGDAATSQQTFQQAIRARKGYRDLTCLAWAQAVTGQREAALQTFKLALEDAEKLPIEEQRRALSDLMPWQLEIGDREGALETVEKAREVGALDIIGLAGRVGNWKLALQHMNALSDDSRKAGALAYIVRTLVKTKSPLGGPEVLKQLGDTASTILEHAPPKDRSAADHMFKNIAVTQAASGDLPGAQRTIANISSILQNGAYSEVVHVLIDKGDLATAGRVLAELKDEWHPLTDSFRRLGAAYSHAGETQAGLAWDRQQQNLYEKANGLLGVAQGLLKQHGIEKLWHSQLSRRNLCPDMSKYD